jgi:hypothetical protein
MAPARTRTALGFIAVLAFVVAAARARASDATLAPADATFGRSHLTVFGIINQIRDCARRFDAGADPHALIGGPLVAATDAIRAWEARYPHDPWIASDLLALETAYLHLPGDEALAGASATATWLGADYPTSPASAAARMLVIAATAPTPPPPALLPPLPTEVAPLLHATTVVPPPSGAWARFGALRAVDPPGPPR